MSITQSPSAFELKLQVSDAAIQQIKLMLEHDYTLKGKIFRIKIGGKGCGGFTYQTGFSEADKDDLTVVASEVIIHVDSFTAHYINGSTLDYQFDPKNHEDGFVITNPREKEFAGKFFKDTSKLPPWAKP
jgi:iron-sulfur cluster assembly accessory protein